MNATRIIIKQKLTAYFMNKSDWGEQRKRLYSFIVAVVNLQSTAPYKSFSYCVDWEVIVFNKKICKKHYFNELDGSLINIVTKRSTFDRFIDKFIEWTTFYEIRTSILFGEKLIRSVFCLISIRASFADFPQFF